MTGLYQDFRLERLNKIEELISGLQEDPMFTGKNAIDK